MFFSSYLDVAVSMQGSLANISAARYLSLSCRVQRCFQVTLIRLIKAISAMNFE